MRILVVGGYGLIGAYVLARLHAEGHAVIGAGRDVRAAARRFAYAEWIAADLSRMGLEDWRPRLAGIDAVVNCAGGLQDSPRDSLRAVHVDGPAALWRACVEAGVRRVVHISAAGVGAGRPTAFNATKLESESRLRALDLDWVILRPGLVLAPAAYGGTALLRALAAFPFAIPAVYPDQVVQVVWADDVAKAVAAAIPPDTPARMSLDLAHAEPLTLGQVLTSLRLWLGLAPAPVLTLPAALAAPVSWGADALAWLGWRSTLRSTTLEQLRAGIRAEAAPALEAALGLKLKSLDEALASYPSGVQERWFAQAYLVKPLAIAILALFWLASGAIGLTVGGAKAVGLLTGAGFSAPLAEASVLSGSAVDIALAVLISFRRTARLGCLGMIAVTAAYLAAASLWLPDLWLDPLGPLVKSVPAAMLALAVLALMDER